ncbi:serine hydrolase domain-containing protein [Hyphococcus sp.]|uniref:serine hydrolase domain-containing protein n=1 Tax=Hyphococcus sp. TaxID=2038636 RepID=UPI00207F4B30|nr:MAG: serine hydrolase [Marinicaulis sp.]
MIFRKTAIAKRACLMILTMIANIAVVIAGDNSDTQLDIMLERIRRDHAIPALAVGVVDAGEIRYLRTFGAPQDARFRAASISKLLTAQAIARLAEGGAVSLDDDLGRHVPALAERGVTLRHLLTHTSGLADGPRPRNRADASAPDAYVEELAKAPLFGSPGAAWRYTDSEYNLLGVVITAVSGRPYMEHVTVMLLAPIGADGASMFPAARDDVLAPHLNFGFALPAPSRPFDIAYAPSEGLVTDVESLTRWLAATLNHDPRLLRPATYEAMLAPQYGDHAAIGWQVGARNGRRIAQHGGSFTGWSALIYSYPDERRGFVVLTNAHDAPRWAIVDAIEAVLDNRTPIMPAPPWGRRIGFWCAIAFVAALASLVAWRISRRPLNS